MTVPDHAERFRSASCMVRCYSQRFKCVNSCIKKNIIIINDKDIHRIENHIIPLPFRNGKIQNYGKCRSFSLLAVTVNGSIHQIDHLLRDGKSQTSPLNAVYPAVCLA